MFGMIWWVIAVAAAVWVLLDVWTKQQSMDQTHKIVWSVAAVIASVLTAVVYYFLVKRK